MDGADVERAAAESVAALAPHHDRDWRVPAVSLGWSCWTTAAHIAHDLTAYAFQLASRAPSGYLPLDLRIRAGTAPAELCGWTAALPEGPQPGTTRRPPPCVSAVTGVSHRVATPGFEPG
ncbi:hypothetical protein ACFWTC_01520 [Streptomyces sp. NPDC058619]|uniref:hypothetical protein n=1 Tax=unclassified Streptomyces TaxID=2593676 RepID=UPI00365261E2